MITPEWISAIAAVIGVIISIFTLVYVKQIQQKIGGIHLEDSIVKDNKVVGSGSIISNKG